MVIHWGGRGPGHSSRWPKAATNEPTIALSASTVLETASANTVIGALSVVNHPSGSSGWTFAETTDPDTRFNISSANLRTTGDWSNTTGLIYYQVTITASKGGETDIGPQAFTVRSLAVLGNLALSSYAWIPGTPSSGSITGAHDSNEVITLGSGWPTGLTINSAARTWAYDGTGVDSTGTGSLIGTHPQASNSPHTTSGLAWALSTSSGALPWTPANASAGTIVAWWDPSDASTRTSSDDARIDALTDKSGNGHTLTGATTTRPNFNYDWMGKEAMGFDSTNDVLVSDTIVQTQPFTIFQSVYPFTAGNDYKTTFDAAGAVLLRSKQAGTALLYAGTAYTPALWAQAAQIVKARFAAGAGYQSINGAAETSGAVGAGTINGAVRLGDSAINDAPYGGFICETVLLNASVTSGSDLDDRMTGYMAWGNGTFESLPSGHAYRYAAPKVGITPAVPSVTRSLGEFIAHGSSGDWNATNIFDPNIVEHPSDATKLLLFASGQAEPPATGVASIGRYIIDKSDPLATPTFTGVVLTAGVGWDNGDLGVRLGTVINVAGTLYMYYCTQRTSVANEIGVATSVDDGVTWTKQGAALLSPTGDEATLGEPAIWWESGVATIIYDYRTTAGGDDSILPGYRYATASSLTGSFTRGYGPGGAGSPDILRRPRRGLQCEAHQILKKNGRYYLICEVGGNPTDATPYRLYLASCATLTGRYTWEKLVLAEAGSGSSFGDKYHVATPYFGTINGTDYLFWTGAPDHDQPYYTNRWNMYAGPITDVFDIA